MIMPHFSNFLEDLNPFKLAGPPTYWLRALTEFDPSLVVVPSRQGFYYRLAQRRRLSLSEKLTQDALFNESDTKMLASYGLVPVTTILATANWSNPLMWEELRQRAPWRMGGASQVLKQMDAQEAAKQASIQADIDDHTTIAAKDGWGLYKKKLGLQSHMWIPKGAKPTSDPEKPRSAALIIPKTS